jgi:putative transposase
MDRLLDNVRSGPVYLRQPQIAEIICECLHYNAHDLNHFELHAFVVMPNHVHLLLTPSIPLPKLTKSLKGITAKRANEFLGMTGNPFWQEESYDHFVRNDQEFERITRYIEHNPIRAGLVVRPEEYRWSSAYTIDSKQNGDQGIACRRGRLPHEPGCLPTKIEIETRAFLF